MRTVKFKIKKISGNFIKMHPDFSGNYWLSKRNGKITEKRKRQFYFSGNPSSVRVIGKKGHGQKKSK